MRFLRTRPSDERTGTRTILELHQFPDRPVYYAILSHTWGALRDEVLFAGLLRLCDQDVFMEEGFIKVDLASGYGLRLTQKPGWKKIECSLQQAWKDGYKWLWADTACIDKSSSAELSEAINTMWTLYQQSAICYVYLEDVSLKDSEILDCRWATRGWTLQELLAPTYVKFYNHKWEYLGERTALATILSRATRIDIAILEGGDLVQNASVAKRMSWAAHRKTTREEDRAYSLMGLFGVNMPMLYGEGERAFLRLQEEIMKRSSDHSILAWRKPRGANVGIHGLLADRPEDFSDSADYEPYMYAGEPLTMTGRGLSTTLNLSDLSDGHDTGAAKLSCPYSQVSGGNLTIELVKLATGSRDFGRINCDRIGHTYDDWVPTQIFVPWDLPARPLDHVKVFKHRFHLQWVRSTMHYIDAVWLGPFQEAPYPRAADQRERKWLNHKTYYEKTSSKSLTNFEVPSLNSNVLVIVDSSHKNDKFAILLGLDYVGGIHFDFQIPDPYGTTESLLNGFQPHALGQTAMAGDWKLTMKGSQRFEEGKMIADIQVVDFNHEKNRGKKLVLTRSEKQDADKRELGTISRWDAVRSRGRDSS